MQSVNSTIIVGRIGSDPKVISFGDNKEKVTLSVATNTGYGTNQRTQWHHLVFYGNLVEGAKKLKKSDSVFVRGQLEQKSWIETATNTKKYATEIKVDEFGFAKDAQTQNVIYIMGNVGADAEIIKFNDGGTKTVLRVATNTGFGDHQKTQWHTVSFFSKPSLLVSKLVKGDAIFVRGQIEQKNREENGEKKQYTEIYAQEFSVIKGEIGRLDDAPNLSNTNQRAASTPLPDAVNGEKQQVGYGKLDSENPYT